MNNRHPMSDKSFLRGLQRRGVSFSIFNNTVRWSGGTLSKAEKRRLRRLRPQVAAMLAKQSASPAVLAGVDSRWDTAPSSDWSWRPPCAVDPGRVVFSRPKRMATAGSTLRNSGSASQASS